MLSPPQSRQAPKGKLQENQSLIFPWILTWQDAVPGTAGAIFQKDEANSGDRRGEREKETQPAARRLSLKPVL